MSISPLLSTALVDVIPEARLNLVIYYLKQDEINEAYYLIKDLEPTVPQEYILKGVVNAAGGQVINHLIQGWELKSLARDSNHFFEKKIPNRIFQRLATTRKLAMRGGSFQKKNTDTFIFCTHAGARIERASEDCTAILPAGRRFGV